MPTTIERVTLRGPTTTGDRARCDFCSAFDPPTCYIADDISIVMSNDIKNLILSSDSHWGACDECAVLIEARDKDRLYQRCLDAFRRITPSDDTISMLSLKIIQDTMFWGAFTGKRHPASAHQRIEI
jgi:hypothetical protein